MAMLADTADAVIGAGTHTDTHTACLLDRLGRQIAVTTVPAGAARCRMLLAWARRNAPEPRLAWAVEGTRSHGLGLTRYLRARDQAVTEAGRPPRASKRPGGKSGPADAARAARDALAAGKLAQPRANGAREALRILLAARCQATTARTAAVNTFKALIQGAPDRLRQELRGLSRPRQTARCRTLRVHASKPVAEQVLRAGRRRLATHIRTWDRELRANKAQLRQLITQMMPVLLDQPGVGPMSAAQLLVSWSHPGRCRSEAASPPSQGQSAGSILRQDHPAQACPGSGRPGSPGADRGPAGETRWRPDAAGWFFAGCPADVAACAASRLRGQHWKITSEVTPLPAWPAVPRSYVLGTRDPVINPAWSRRAASAVLEVRAVEIDAGHSPFLAIPAVLARILDTLAADPGPRLSGALPSSRWVPWPCPRWFPSRDQLLILA